MKNKLDNATELARLRHENLVSILNINSQDRSGTVADAQEAMVKWKL